MRATVSLIALACAIAGCGYKTPLALPKAQPQVQRPAPPPPERADDKKAGDKSTRE